MNLKTWDYFATKHSKQPWCILLSKVKQSSKETLTGTVSYNPTSEKNQPKNHKRKWLQVCMLFVPPPFEASKGENGRMWLQSIMGQHCSSDRWSIHSKFHATLGRFLNLICCYDCFIGNSMKVQISWQQGRHKKGTW